MSEPRRIPDEILASQATASNPQHSVWVSANAGSGKTHVLSQRVIRLLLDGTEPSKILCLTYTRAAAANMANRVFKELSEWATLPDGELSTRIAAVEGRSASAKKIRKARQLFAEALETPGGLKIQTIHAFCEAVLHQFPLEANIAGHFEMLDPAMEDALFGEARRDVVTGSVAKDDAALAEAFATILSRGGEFALDGLLGEIVQKRDPIRNFLSQIGPAEDSDVLIEEFGFAPHDTAASLASEVWPLPGFDAATFSAFIANSIATGSSNVLEKILPHAKLAFDEGNAERRLDLLRMAFLKADGDPYAPAIFKKALVQRMPDLLERYAKAVDTILAVSDRVALFRMLELSRAALVLADRMIGRYERLKSARGFLDFNDLINRTVRLLERRDVGPWIHYKLDQGIDHILLDEAQDTSPDQWRVVRKLAEEFFAGLGAQDGVNRTVFAVGDEKQSIYSFQGADPAGFDDSRQGFRTHASNAERPFEEVKLTWSFRSTEDVIAAVDTIFDAADRRRGLGLDWPGHKAIRASDPGYVELWPTIGATSAQEPDDWREAVDHETAPAAQLAQKIANTIKHWLDHREVLEGKGRRLKAGDILVLVRKRDRFIHALSRDLKTLQIAVAGADRLSLRGHIAVQDMMVLGRFVLQPNDDLSLAALLRSPVFGLSEDDLFGLAHARPEGQSLYASLRQRAGMDLVLRYPAEQLEIWENEGAFRTVFDFYARVLGRDGVRAKMIARLGDDAGDILDEFLSFCIAEEKAGLPGLDAFLETLDTAAPEIRREMDQGRDEVRIMTTHAAKGLEAPVVFLVDGGAAPIVEQLLPRLLPFPSQHGLWDGDAFLWRAGKDIKNSVSQGIVASLKEKAEEEYRRLLYVGLTRAEDRLVVCGYYGVRTPLPTNWHGMVGASFAGSDHVTSRKDEIVGDTVQRFRVSPERPLQLPPDDSVHARASPALPSWLEAKLPVDLPMPKPLAPSGASVAIDAGTDTARITMSPVLDPAAGPSFAIARGLVAHKLLQVLPELPEEYRRAAAKRYTTRAAADWQAADRQALLDQVFAILEDDRYAPLFSGTSRAEVGIMGQVSLRGGDRTVSGKIDRLVVSDSEVRIVDYKTNRPAPQTLEEVTEAYVTQMALYRTLLQPLYPGREVAASLLFTEGPTLIEVPAGRMDSAIAGLSDSHGRDTNPA